MLRRIRTLLLVVLVGAAAACDESTTAPDDSPEGPVALPVPYRGQQTQVWCWAATSEMVLAYYGVNVPQCEILSAWMQMNCCIPNPACETAGSLQVIQGTLHHFGALDSFISGALTFAQVQAEIDAGRPMIVAYNNSFAGHVVVIFGYDPVNGTVFVHDPYFGTFYPRYGDSFSYSGTMYWHQTIAGITR